MSRHVFTSEERARGRGRPRSRLIEPLRKLAAEGLTKTQAARRLGITRERVWQLAQRHGIRFCAGTPGYTIGSAVAALRRPLGLPALWQIALAARGDYPVQEGP